MRPLHIELYASHALCIQGRLSTSSRCMLDGTRHLARNTWDAEVAGDAQGLAQDQEAVQRRQREQEEAAAAAETRRASAER